MAKGVTEEASFSETRTELVGFAIRFSSRCGG
jgi:hypothetical protein